MIDEKKEAKSESLVTVLIYVDVTNEKLNTAGFCGKCATRAVPGHAFLFSWTRESVRRPTKTPAKTTDHFFWIPCILPKAKESTDRSKSYAGQDSGAAILV